LVKGKINVSGTISCVSCPGPVVLGRYIQEMFEVSSHVKILMMGMEIVLETSVSSFHQLMLLIAREDFMERITY
jgi:hypothetical protein